MSVIAIGILAPAGVAEAQPPDRQITRDLRQAFPNATEVRLRPNAGGTRQLGPSSWEHQRMVEIVTPTSTFAPEFPNAKAVSYGGAIFLSSNNRRWTYDRMTTGETTYEGLPTPSEADLMRIFRANRFDDFFQYEEYLIGMPELSLREENSCTWRGSTQIECVFLATVNLKRGSGRALMHRIVYVTLRRNAGADTWNSYRTRWTDDTSAGRPEMSRMTPEEIEGLRMLPQILAALPAPTRN